MTDYRVGTELEKLVKEQSRTADALERIADALTKTGEGKTYSFWDMVQTSGYNHA